LRSSSRGYEQFGAGHKSKSDVSIAMSENSLINIGELSKPATVLIEKISDAVGGIFKPYQITRVAKAEAEAERIRADSQIQISDLQRRAMHRFLEEEAKKQVNIEGITQQALPLLKPESNPENMEDDWIANFFEKSRIISDQDMQRLWSRLLAGEANSPGAFSRKTVNLLADLGKNDAELFRRLCGFAWTLGELTPLVFDVQNDIYNRHWINFTSLSHLASLGLIRFDNLAGFIRTRMPKNVSAHFYGSRIELALPLDADNSFQLGKVLFTQAGLELAPVCGSFPIEGFFDFVYDRWASQSFVPKRTTE
jgi:hypothetical protein